MIAAIGLLVLGCSGAPTAGDPIAEGPVAEAPAIEPAGDYAGLILSLDGRWQGDRGGVVLPISRPAQPFTARHRLTLPDDFPPGARALLHADAAGWRLSASVNGRWVDSATGGIAPVVLDLSGWLQPGENELALRFEAPAVDRVLEGQRVQRLAQWTGNVPRPGEVLARGAIRLEGEATVQTLDGRQEAAVTLVPTPYTGTRWSLDAAAISLEMTP